MAASGVHVRAGVRVTARSYTYAVNEMLRAFLEVITSAGMDLHEFESSQPTIEHGLRTWLVLRQLKTASLEIFDPNSGALAARVDFTTRFVDTGDEDYITDIMQASSLLPLAGRFSGHRYRIVAVTTPEAARVAGWNSTEFLNVDQLPLREIGEASIALSAPGVRSLVLTVGQPILASPPSLGFDMEIPYGFPGEMDTALPRSAPEDPRTPGATSASAANLRLEVTIYLSNEAVHEQVQAAVENLLESSGLYIYHREEPEIGSWFRRMRARGRDTLNSHFTREAAMSAAHEAEARIVISQDATITATMMASLGPVITALHPTKDAVIRVGALLIIKVDWVVTVHQLNAAQQMELDHGSALATSPHQIISALNLLHGEPPPPSKLSDNSHPTHLDA